MLEIYILFLVAPLVQNLGSFPSMQECERVGQIIALSRHKGDVKDAETFGTNRLICVKSGLIK